MGSNSKHIARSFRVFTAGLALCAGCTAEPTGVSQGATPGTSPGTPGAVSPGGAPGTGSPGTPGAVMPGGGAGTGGPGFPGTAPMETVQMDDASCTSFEKQRANVLSPVDAAATQLLASMTLDQKISILSGGDSCPNWDCDFNSTGLPELGIDDFKMRDGPRGVHVLSGGQSTTWAVAMARAASFDLDLERRVGDLQGREMRALKYDLSLAPTINTLRHPGWARAQETYGEDPVLLGEMGAAFIQGMQQHVPACPKHFAGNNTDENRGNMVAYMDEQTLRENYTRAFEIAIDKADPGCIMAAYNGVNGDTSSENHHLMTEILRDDWGWEGFVLSDWWATKENGVKSLNAGLDLEMPDKKAFEDIPQAIQMGLVDPARVDEAAQRILNVRARFGQFESAYRNSPANPAIVNEQSHRELAYETALKGAILLKNDGILPLGARATELGFGTAAVQNIMVMGPDAYLPSTQTNSQGVPHGLGDRGSSNTNPPYAVSFIDGLSARAAAGVSVSHSDNPQDAAGADVVVIPVTMQHEDEGEAFGGGGDRDNLTLAGLHPQHWGTKPTSFINQVAAVNPNVVVLLAMGSAIVMEDWLGSARAVVQTFYPGQEGGTATADLLYGNANFSAKLPFTVATDAGHYPEFGNLAASANYDYLHGYRKFEAEGLTPRHWFGEGLSYTTYAYSDLQLLCSGAVSSGGRLNFQVTVTNTGSMAGEEIVQAYVGYPSSAARRPPKELKTFTRVSLAPGESKLVQLAIPIADTAYWADSGWMVEPGAHSLLVGPSADPATLLSTTFEIQ